MSDSDIARASVDAIQIRSICLQENVDKAKAEVSMAEENYKSLAPAFQSLQSKNAVLRKQFQLGLTNLANSQKQNHFHDLKLAENYEELMSLTDGISGNMSKFVDSLQKLTELLEQIRKTTAAFYSDLLEIDEEVTSTVSRMRCDVSLSVSPALTRVAEDLNVIFRSLEDSKARLEPFEADISNLEREIKAYKNALASSAAIYVINKDRFSILKRFLTSDMNFIVSTMTQSDYRIVDEVLDHLELKQLQYIFYSEPNSNITLLGCKYGIQFAHWTAKKDHVQMSLIRDDLWSTTMGPVKHQGDHECCWAIVSAELVSNVRHVLKRDRTYVEYSTQYLVDFTRPELRCLSRKPAHFCYPLHVKHALDFISKRGIEREDARPFRRYTCEKEVSPAEPSNAREYIKGVITPDKIEDVVETLAKHAIACDIPIFEPEYSDIGDKIYRGPTSRISRYVTYHSGNLMGGGEENGEKYLRFRSSIGEGFGYKGTMKISMEVMLMCLSSRRERVECGVDCDVTMECPFPLMVNFVYPSLLSKEEEEKRKQEDQRSSRSDFSV